MLFRDDKEGQPRFASAAWVDDLVEVNRTTPMQVPCERARARERERERESERARGPASERESERERADDGEGVRRQVAADFDGWRSRRKEIGLEWCVWRRPWLGRAATW